MPRRIEKDLRERVVDLISRTSRVERQTIRGTDKLREDLGMDSLASLELLSVIGDDLDLDFELDDAMQVETVDGAIAFVERCVADSEEVGP